MDRMGHRGLVTGWLDFCDMGNGQPGSPRNCPSPLVPRNLRELSCRQAGIDSFSALKVLAADNLSRVIAGGNALIKYRDTIHPNHGDA